MEDEIRSVLIIESPYYRDISEALMEGALTELESHGVFHERIAVPGALEIPVALGLAFRNGLFGTDAKHQGCIALGCVIRGETSHYDIVANESARGLMTLATEGGIPVGNGILTVDTHEQAKVRAAPDGKNKGGDAARACLALMELSESFEDVGQSWSREQ